LILASENFPFELRIALVPFQGDRMIETKLRHNQRTV